MYSIINEHKKVTEREHEKKRTEASRAVIEYDKNEKTDDNAIRDEAVEILEKFWNNRVMLLKSVSSNLNKTLLVPYFHSNCIIGLPEYKNKAKHLSDTIVFFDINCEGNDVYIRLFGTDNCLIKFNFTIPLQKDNEDMFGKTLLSIMKETGTFVIDADGIIITYDVLGYILQNKLGGVIYV